MSWSKFCKSRIPRPIGRSTAESVTKWSRLWQNYGRNTWSGSHCPSWALNYLNRLWLDLSPHSYTSCLEQISMLPNLKSMVTLILFLVISKGSCTVAPTLNISHPIAPQTLKSLHRLSPRLCIKAWDLYFLFTHILRIWRRLGQFVRPKMQQYFQFELILIYSIYLVHWSYLLTQFCPAHFHSHPLSVCRTFGTFCYHAALSIYSLATAGQRQRGLRLQ